MQYSKKEYIKYFLDFIYDDEILLLKVLQVSSLSNLLFGNQAFGTKLSFCASMISLQVIS